MKDFREKVNEFKQENGNINFSQKEMIMYLIKKVDCIDKKLNEGNGKIAENRTNIKTLYWILGSIITISIATFGFVIK